MNTKQLIAAAAIALVGSTTAFAQAETELQNFGAAQPSTTTRAAVKAEYLRAQAAGELPSSEVVAVSPPAAKSGVTRAAVRAELLQARATGKFVQIGDSVQFVTDVAAGPARTREEVRAEAVAFTRSGHAARVQAGH